VNGSGFTPVRLGKTNKIEIGDEVVVIGSPRGEETTVSTGIISSIRKGSNKLQFTAPISNGSSGGPLFNNYGELIGITAASKVNAQNLNFAIPSSEIDQLLTPSNTSAIQSQAPLKVSFDQALSRYLVSHNDEQARMAAAEYYIKRGNADKVLELTSNQAPSNEVTYLRANAYFFKNDAVTAAELFNQLPEHYFKNEPKLYLYQAGLALKQHDLQKAKLALERYNIYSDEKDALYFYTVGDLSTAFAFSESRQLDQDQYYEKAIGFYEIAAKKDSRFVSAFYKKGLIQLTMGDLCL
jgi:tetratricopeptide (TPR) repeat protein